MDVGDAGCAALSAALKIAPLEHIFEQRLIAAGGAGAGAGAAAGAGVAAGGGREGKKQDEGADAGSEIDGEQPFGAGEGEGEDKSEAPEQIGIDASDSDLSPASRRRLLRTQRQGHTTPHHTHKME